MGTGGRKNNFERIKNMSVDEMAEWMVEHLTNTCGFDCPAYGMCEGEEINGCKDNIKQWLLAEVEE